MMSNTKTTQLSPSKFDSFNDQFNIKYFIIGEKKKKKGNHLTVSRSQNGYPKPASSSK